MKFKIGDKVRFMDSFNGVIVDTRTNKNQCKEACLRLSKKSKAYDQGHNLTWHSFNMLTKLK